ncbi:MAG: hypothetical protein AAF693_12815 [Bacteroidota bacterium]
MKNLILTFVTLLAGAVSYAQQPFEKYGKEVPIATMSNGKFEEFFDQDTLVQIGTAILNRLSGELYGFVKYDTLHSEATLDPQVISRWLSPDPLADDFTSLSPYNFVENNPIRYTDPDGLAPFDMVREEDPIYSKKGELIGDDGKNNGAIHVVTKNKQAKAVASTGGITDLSNVDHVTLNGGESTVKGVVASVNATASDGLHEEGGHTEAILTTEDELKSGSMGGGVKTVAWKPGKARTGTNNASIVPFDGTADPGAALLDNWHTHTSGTVTTTNAQGQEITVRSATGPSPADNRFAGSMSRRGVTTLQVDTKGTPRVNFINRQGTQTSIKLKHFKKLKN